MKITVVHLCNKLRTTISRNLELNKSKQGKFVATCTFTHQKQNPEMSSFMNSLDHYCRYLLQDLHKACGQHNSSLRIQKQNSIRVLFIYSNTHLKSNLRETILKSTFLNKSTLWITHSIHIQPESLLKPHLNGDNDLMICNFQDAPRIHVYWLS